MKTQRTIAILGGGVSGALTAYHLVRRAVPAQVVVVEPRLELGLGLAYATPTLQHLLNVPAGKISALPEQPGHFLNWLHTNYDPTITAEDFAPRAVFGQYIQSLVYSVAPWIEHRRTTAIDYAVDDDGATVCLADGSRLRAGAVVLATGNFDPPMPGHVEEESVRNGSYCHSAWEEATYTHLAKDAPVTLIGTGLTAVDVLLRLRERGHRGTVTAISRHGVFPNRHAAYEPLAECVIPDPSPRKIRELLRLVHTAIKNGAPWRAVIDSLRPRTNEIWLSLPLAEQRRFRRHIQRRWEVVRHRMAPSIADQIDAELSAGTLVKRRGSVHAILPDGEGSQVLFATNDGPVDAIRSSRVINCTGPNMNYRQVGSSLLNRLFEQGLAVPGPLGGGLASNTEGALQAKDGSFSRILFNVGPGRQGMLLESIAVPELREQAADLAVLLDGQVRQNALREQTYSESLPISEMADYKASVSYELVWRS